MTSVIARPQFGATSHKKFTKAAETAVRMMLRAQYFMPLYYSMVLYEDESIPTLCTNGVGLWVNPEFWALLDRDQRMTAVAHEIGHKMLMHSTRRGARDPFIWNLAGDFVINLMLVESGFTPLVDIPVPGGRKFTWCYDVKYAGMTTEAVYDSLIKEMEGNDGKKGQGTPQKGGGGTDEGEGDGEAAGDGTADSEGSEAGERGGEDDDGQSGAGKSGKPLRGAGAPDARGRASQAAEKKLGPMRDLADFGTNPDGSDAEDGEASPADYEQRVRKELQESTMIAKMQGNSPAWLERVIGNAEHAKVNWWEVLEQYVRGLTRADYSWRRWSKREFVKTGSLAPDMYEPSLGGVVLFVDCSGSVGGPELAVFNKHYKDVLDQVKPAWIEIVYFETGPSKVERFERGEYDMDENLKPIGGGGTSFSWFADHIESMEETPQVAMCLTDMYGGFGREPGVPFIWLSNSGKDDAPYGSVLHIA